MARQMVLLDPRLLGRPDILELTEAGKHRAVLAHVFALIYVTQYSSDGLLPRKALRIVQGRKSDAATLVAAGLWFETDDGWGIYDWAINQLYRPREPISKTKRLQVFTRDGFACAHCGATERLSIDHITPWAKGGSNATTNLQTLCTPCNSRKRDR